MTYFDELETRSTDERAADLGRALPEQIAPRYDRPRLCRASARGGSCQCDLGQRAGGAAGLAQGLT